MQIPHRTLPHWTLYDLHGAFLKLPGEPSVLTVQVWERPPWYYANNKPPNILACGSPRLHYRWHSTASAGPSLTEQLHPIPVQDQKLKDDQNNCKVNDSWAKSSTCIRLLTLLLNWVIKPQFWLHMWPRGDFAQAQVWIGFKPTTWRFVWQWPNQCAIGVPTCIRIPKVQSASTAFCTDFLIYCTVISI